MGTTRKLTTLPRYANGPCLYAPDSEICTIDSATVLDYPGFGYMESITDCGRYFEWDGSGNLTVNPPLGNIARMR